MNGVCTYTRAAIGAAREGLALIRKLEPHSYQALFLAIGLVTATRHVWHALTLRDRKDHPQAIGDWMAQPPQWCGRTQALLNVARDRLIKEWDAIPQVSTGSAGYQMAIFIPSRPQQEGVLTSAEVDERELVARLADAMGNSGDAIRGSVRIDLLHEYERTLDLWDAEVMRIEGQLG